MTCYNDLRTFNSHAYDRDELDNLLESYGSEVYICAATDATLHGSRFELTHQLIDYAVELIDWQHIPEPLYALLSIVDHDGMLASGDPQAGHQLCYQLLQQTNNLSYRIALLSTFAYCIEHDDPHYDIYDRLAEDHLDALHHAELVS